MKNKRVFPITIVGFSEKEQSLLRSIFLITNERERAYLVVERLNDPLGEIVLVNGDDPDSVAFSRSKNVRCNPGAPNLFIGGRAVRDPDAVCIQRPFGTSKLLAALDKITIKELRYFPELVITNESTGEHRRVTGQFSAAELDAQLSSKFKALVVDDSQPVRELIKIELGLLGVKSIPAQAGEQALELLAREKFDIVFLDITLPGIDGYEVCKRIKANPSLRSTPVCMLTGKTSPFNKIRGKMAGCDDYLTKPVQAHNFLKVVEKLIPDMHQPKSSAETSNPIKRLFAQES